MERRSFVKRSLLTGAAIGPLSGFAMNQPKKPVEEYYELRVYTVKTDAQRKLVEDYYEKAAIPALNDLGSRTVGVFREIRPEAGSRLYVVIPFRAVEDYLQVRDKLLRKVESTEAGAAYLNASATEPAYERIESSLLRAFAGMPQLSVPPKKSRIFELRRYESASESAGKKKIEMFNTAEIGIFKRTGLTPVFFGETIIGGLQPNLTYMITFDDMNEHDRNWKTFGTDPEWKKISSIPEYADAKIVSRITNFFLEPTDFSQI